MNLTDYVKNMKATTDREAVVDSQNNTLQELTGKTIPLFMTAASAWKGRSFKSKEALEFEADYKRFVGLRNGSMFGDMLQRLENMRSNMEFVSQESIKTLGPTIMRDNVTAQQATLLQTTDAVGFVTRMSRRLLETITIYETNAAGDMGKDYLSDNITKGELKFVQERFVEFATLMSTLGEEPRQFKKKFEDIPDVLIDPDQGIIDALLPKLKVDPYRMGILASPFNLLFLVGKWWGEWQVSRYKEAKADLERIQARILLLEEIVAGKGNPSLEKEIELRRDEASSLTVKINKFEESLK